MQTLSNQSGGLQDTCLDGRSLSRHTCELGLEWELSCTSLNTHHPCSPCPQVPCLTCGCRGMISASVEVRGPEKDLHSGNEGGVFVEPLSCLNKVLASLVDSHSQVGAWGWSAPPMRFWCPGRHGQQVLAVHTHLSFSLFCHHLACHPLVLPAPLPPQVMVPGFNLSVRDNMLDSGWDRLAASNEFSLDRYKEQLGVPNLISARTERELLHARWCQPTLSVVDVRVGAAEEEASCQHYRFGPTRFSVIPKAAVGKISVRFVPNQSADALIESLTAHIDHEFAKLRSGNTVKVTVGASRPAGQPAQPAQLA